MLVSWNFLFKASMIYNLGISKSALIGGIEEFDQGRNPKRSWGISESHGNLSRNLEASEISVIECHFFESFFDRSDLRMKQSQSLPIKLFMILSKLWN